MDTHTPPAKCPECGAALQVITDGLIGQRFVPSFYVRGSDNSYVVLRPARFAACTGCEFCVSF